MDESFRDLTGVVLSPKDRKKFEKWRSAGKISVDAKGKITWEETLITMST